MEQEINKVFIGLAWVFGGIFCILVIVQLTIAIKDYSKAAKSVKLEIIRSDGRELAHWKRELKALRLSLIPGVSLELARKIVRKKRKKHKYLK